MGNNHLSGIPTLTASTPATGHVNLLGVSLPDFLFTWLIAGLFILLVIILFLITFFYVSRQIRLRKEFAKLERRAEADAMRVAQQMKEERSTFFKSASIGSASLDLFDEKVGERSAMPVERDSHT